MNQQILSEWRKASHDPVIVANQICNKYYDDLFDEYGDTPLRHCTTEEFNRYIELMIMYNKTKRLNH